LKQRRNRLKGNVERAEIKNRWEMVELPSKKYRDQELAGSTE
jgi:hypothetical protein